MKKALFTFAIVLLAVAVQAQTAVKVHSTGQISLQSATTSYGIQIPTSGVISLEPNVTGNYAITAKTKTFAQGTRSWALFMESSNQNLVPQGNVFYVRGNGDTYAYNYYSLSTSGNGGGGSTKGMTPIVGATELAAGMKGYYMDAHEFEDTTIEELENSEEIVPEALEGILLDFGKGKTLGLDPEVLEQVLPEAVRHDPEGKVGINYNAVVTVLVEAFKEQQAKIEQLEAVLREHGLMR